MPNQVVRILDFLNTAADQDFFSYSRPLVERRIIERSTQLGYGDMRDYSRLLMADVNEADNLVRMLRVRYSRFFRQPLQFHLLREIVIPTLLHQGNGGIFKVWSAACAAGEEAFSVAIILDEIARAAGCSRPATIFATDIAEDALEEGRRAVYALDRMEEVSLKQAKTYFSPVNEGYRVCDLLRQRVSFSRHDMLDARTFAPPESVFGGFDLILCRNFLMYLTKEACRNVFDRLLRALNPGGILMLGKAEAVPGTYQPLLEKLYDFGGLYRKNVKR